MRNFEDPSNAYDPALADDLAVMRGEAPIDRGYAGHRAVTKAMGGAREETPDRRQIRIRLHPYRTAKAAVFGILCGLTAAGITEWYWAPLFVLGMNLGEHSYAD